MVSEKLCPKCNRKDYFGIYNKGSLVKMSCLDCDYEDNFEKELKCKNK